MNKLKIAIYPGTFDPITFGHLDIIKRALKIVDRLIIAVAKDSSKKPIFTLEQRVLMAQAELKNVNKNKKVAEVVSFEGLLVDFAKSQNANIIIRGLRAVSDFEYEFQMSGMNAKLDPEVQTIFLPASESTHFIASKLVREVSRLGGDVSYFVSPRVKKELDKVFNK